MTPTVQKLLKRVGYPLLGVFLFVVCLYATFPYDRLRRALEDHLAASGQMEVQIGDLGPRFFLGLSAEDVVVRMMPKPSGRRASSGGDDGDSPPAPKPQVMRMARIGLSVGLFALLAGNLSADYVVELDAGGEVEGSIEASKKEGIALVLKAEGVKAKDVPALQSLGPPVRGSIALDIDLKVPQGKWAQAEGAISFRCRNCSFGDGKALLKVPGNPWLSAGITVPRIRLGSVTGDIQFAKGAARLQNFGARSEDIKLDLQGAVNLQDPVALSRIDLKLRLKIEDALRQKFAAFDLIEGQLRRFKGSDGYISLPVRGTFRNPQVAGMGGRRGRAGRARFPPT